MYKLFAWINVLKKIISLFILMNCWIFIRNNWFGFSSNENFFGHGFGAHNKSRIPKCVVSRMFITEKLSLPTSKWKIFKWCWIHTINLKMVSSTLKMDTITVKVWSNFKSSFWFWFIFIEIFEIFALKLWYYSGFNTEYLMAKQERIPIKLSVQDNMVQTKAAKMSQKMNKIFSKKQIKRLKHFIN